MLKKTFFSILFSAVCITFSAAQNSVRCMLFSDPHVYAPSLLNDSIDGSHKYLNTNPKLLEHSAELFDSAVARVLRDKPDILLIPGDLTYNGETASHEYVIAALTSIQNTGTHIYVVPGNHDITLATTDFASLYAPFGYQSAVLRMPNALSYMVYLPGNLALICMDSTRPNIPNPSSYGGLTEATLAWVEQAAAMAQQDGRTIIGMMHHQLVDHFTEESRVADSYVANTHSNYPALASVQNRLTATGMQVVFTGHFHAHTIQRTWPVSGDPIYDVSTGSLSAYGSPIRYLTFTDSALHITTDTICRYQQLAYERNRNTTRGAIHSLSTQGYGLIGSMLKQFNIPESISTQMHLPTSSQEFEKDLLHFFMEPANALLCSFMRGDEDQPQHHPDLLYKNMVDSATAYMNYVINGTQYRRQVPILGSIDMWIATRAMAIEMATPYLNSLLRNWVSTPAHYQSDWSTTLPLRPTTPPITSTQTGTTSTPSPNSQASTTGPTKVSDQDVINAGVFIINGLKKFLKK